MPRQQAYSTIDGSTPSRRRKALLAITGAGALMLVAALAFNVPDALRGAIEDPTEPQDMEAEKGVRTRAAGRRRTPRRDVIGSPTTTRTRIPN
jgi:hypothetical protein